MNNKKGNADINSNTQKMNNLDSLETMSFDNNIQKSDFQAKSLAIEGECPLVIGPIVVSFGGTLRIYGLHIHT